VTQVLITGATGYIGGHLAPALLQRGLHVRCLARDPSRAALPERADVVQGDVLQESTLPPALEGTDVAYYLVHSMGGDGAFAQRDRAGAEAFGRAARAAGVRRVVYLGGLEGGDSEHLRSREEVAAILAAAVPDTVHARAAMVIGAGSASFLILRHLVERLPAMVCPRWIDTRTQPIAIRDVVGALAALADPAAPVASEVQLGGADVLTYREMMHRFAAAAGRRAPLVLRVPVLTPRLSSYWLGLVTPVDPGVARPLVQGLSAEMLVRTAPPAGINDAPLGFDDAVREALAEGAG
jgi:uncharacterized protein YbjT (DUF2867 family)